MAEFIEKPKQQKRGCLTAILIGIVLLLIIVGALSEKKEEKTPSESIQSPKETLEEATNIYSAGQEVKVGKSIWKVLGVIKEGRVLRLPKGSELGRIYYKEPTNGKLIGVVLDFVNFDKISLWSFKGGEMEAVLIDGNNREFKQLSYDKATSIISAEEERKLDDYFRGTPLPNVFLYIVPKNSTGFKIKVRDETKYSNKEALINLGL